MSYVGKDDGIALSALTTVSLNEFAEVVLGGSLAISIVFVYLGPEQAIRGGVDWLICHNLTFLQLWVM